MSNEIISVIIPVYNVEPYLPECLESILRQTYSGLEIIAVNDGSSDGSRAILTRYARQDRRIRVIDQCNAGQSAARNAGLRAATGAYIAFVDSDDRIEADMLERMMNRMRASGADVVECGYNEFFVNPDSVRSVPYPKGYDEITGTDNIMHSHVRGEISLLVWNKLYKAEKVREIAFVEGKKYEDILWSAEALMNTRKICSVRDCLYHWRQRGGSTTNSRPTKNRLLALEHFDQRIDMLHGYPRAALAARGRFVCECYLECEAMCGAGDAALLEAAKRHSMQYRKKRRLSVMEIVKLGSMKEVVRYFYYLLKFYRVQYTLRA